MADKSVFDDMLAAVGAAPPAATGNLIDSFPLDGFAPLDVPGTEGSPVVDLPLPAAKPVPPAQAQPAAAAEPAAGARVHSYVPPVTAPAAPAEPAAPAASARVHSYVPPASVAAEPPARVRPYTPPVTAPEEEEYEDLPPVVLTAQGARTAPSAGALELVKARYEEAVSLEYYQMQQAGRLQIVTALLLAAASVTLSLCFSNSVPGYFEFYISACACPIALALVLAMAFAVVRAPQDGAARQSVKEDLSAHELYDTYVSLQEEVALANRRRAAAIRRNTVCLWLCVALCIGFIITGVGIGA